MPTQAEIDAAARAIMAAEYCVETSPFDQASQGERDCYTAMATAALTAAEAVRAAAVDTMTEAELLAGLDPYINADGTYTCEVCRAFRAQQPLDQRMTQTHAPLAAALRRDAPPG